MATYDTTEFGRVLRAARIDAGMTQGDVAKRLNLSVPYVSDVERGYRAPLTLERLMDAADLLETDPSVLVAARARYYGVMEVPITGRADVDGAALALALEALGANK